MSSGFALLGGFRSPSGDLHPCGAHFVRLKRWRVFSNRSSHLRPDTPKNKKAPKGTFQFLARPERLIQAGQCWDFDRIIVCLGDIVDHQARAASVDLVRRFRDE